MENSPPQVGHQHVSEQDYERLHQKMHEKFNKLAVMDQSPKSTGAKPGVTTNANMSGTELVRQRITEAQRRRCQVKESHEETHWLFAPDDGENTRPLPCTLHLEKDTLYILVDSNTNIPGKKIDLKHVSFIHGLRCTQKVLLPSEPPQEPADIPAPPTDEQTTTQVKTVWIRTAEEDAYISHRDEETAQQLESDLLQVWAEVLCSTGSDNPGWR